jgi:hypothetical protein
MKTSAKAALVLLASLAIARFSPPLAALPQEPGKAVRPEPTGFEIMRPVDRAKRVGMMLDLRPRLAAMRRDAADKLKAAGLTPTSTQMGAVVRGKRFQPGRAKANHLLGQVANLVMPSLKAQAAAEVGSYGDIGYVIVDSWTDNDDATWEGTIWGHLNDIEGGFCFSFHLDTSASDADTPPRLVASYGGGFVTSARGVRGIKEEDIERFLGKLTRASLAAETISRSPLVPMVAGGCPCSGDGVGDCILRNVLGDSWQTCAAAAVGCGVSGPAWPECVAAACGSWLLVELVQEMWDWWWNCMT